MRTPARMLWFAVSLNFAGLSQAGEAGMREAGAAHPHIAPERFIERYCTECHNSEDWAGGIALDTLPVTDPAADAEVWENVVRKVRGQLMPPPGSLLPPRDTLQGFASGMERALDAAAQHSTATGHVPLQRLTRTEYANEVRNLLDVQVDAAELLPPENEVEGFENVAAALSISPAFLDQYLGAARTVARLAVGSPIPRVADVFHPSPGGWQGKHLDGFPPGTRGGMRFTHHFPLDGEYRLQLPDLDVNLYTWTVETPQSVVVLIDDVEAFRGHIGGADDLREAVRDGATGRERIMQRFADIPFSARAGSREVIVTFVERSRAASDEYIELQDPGFGTPGGVRGPRVMDGVRITGPFGATVLSATSSRRKLFLCEPGEARDELPCARRIAENLARRAFRRPVAPPEVDQLMRFFEAGRRQQGGFDAGIEQMVAATLASPSFLYRGIRPGEATRKPLDDLELASRLSFFLWGQGPDEALLAAAESGRLTERDVLHAQTMRMLADPRAAALVNVFAMKWLDLDDLDTVIPDAKLFPAFSTEMREYFHEEARLFLGSILLGGRSVLDLLTAEHTFLNEELAQHYGVPGVHGPQFRQVTLTDSDRFGLLGKAAVLLRTSYGDRTSPVLRGAWVLDKIIGAPPSPPPPGVETDLSNAVGDVPATIRARLEQHRSAPGCNQCHGVIDPPGLALERFDAIGRSRSIDAAAGAPIDTRTELPDGTIVDGPAQLRAELVRDPAQFVRTLTGKLLMYAIGRELEHFDMPQVRAIVDTAATQDYRLSAIVLGIVDSDAFRLQALAGTAGGAPVTAHHRSQ